MFERLQGFWDFPVFARVSDIVQRSGPPAEVEVQDVVPARRISMPENEYSILDHNIVSTSPMVEYLSQYKMKQTFPSTVFDMKGIKGHRIRSGTPQYTKNESVTYKMGDPTWKINTRYDARFIFRIYNITGKVICSSGPITLPKNSNIDSGDRTFVNPEGTAYQKYPSIRAWNYSGDDIVAQAGLKVFVSATRSTISGTSFYNQENVFCQSDEVGHMVEIQQVASSQIIGKVIFDMVGRYDAVMKLHYIDYRGNPIATSTINVVAGAANHSLYSRSEKDNEGTLKALIYWFASNNNMTHTAIRIEKNQYYPYPQWPRRDGAVRGIIFEQIAPTGLLRAIGDLPDEIEAPDVARGTGTSTDQRMIIT